jgi:antitoxin CptB
MKRKLLYRSIHRGCKETDFLIGEFAKEKIEKMPPAKMKLFDLFLQEDDLEIYDWIMEKAAAKTQYSTLVNEIRKFHKLV